MQILQIRGWLGQAERFRESGEVVFYIRSEIGVPSLTRLDGDGYTPQF